MQPSVIVNNEYTPLQIFLCMPPPPSFPCILHPEDLRVNLAQSSSTEHVLFSNYLLTALHPTPPWSIYRLHVQATQPLKSRQVIMLSALVTSLLELPVMTYNNNDNNSASAKVRHNSCQHSSTPPPSCEQAGGLPGHKWWDGNDCGGREQGWRMNAKQLVWAARM